MTKEYVLTPASVDEAAHEAEEFCQKLRISHEEVLKYRISVEEVLNCWIAHRAGEKFTLKYGKHLGKPYIELTMKGVEVNPFDDDGTFFINSIRSTLKGTPKFSYLSNRNVVTFNIKQKQINQLVVLLLTVAAAVLTGTLLRWALPQSGCVALMEDLIEPLYAAFFRMLNCIAGPMILLSMIWGMYGIGDTGTLGRIGKRLILVFVGAVFLAAGCSTITFPLFRLELVRQTSEKSAFGTVIEMLLDIVPSNIIEPLTSGNTLQIIFLGGIIGIFMLILGRRTQTVAEVVDQLYSIVQSIMEMLSKILPCVIFLMIVRLILNNMLASVANVWKLFLAYIVAGAFSCVVVTLVTAARVRVSPWKIVKTCLPLFMIGITTASSAAGYSTSVETCEKKLGVDRSLVDFGLPLGMVICKIPGTVFYATISLFFAKQTGIACSFGWLATVAFLSAMLSIATPPIPGGSMAAYAVLFSKLGISNDVMAIMLSVDVLFDFLITSMNMYTLPLMLTNVAAGLNLLDRKRLNQRDDTDGRARK